MAELSRMKVGGWLQSITYAKLYAKGKVEVISRSKNSNFWSMLFDYKFDYKLLQSCFQRSELCVNM